MPSFTTRPKSGRRAMVILNTDGVVGSNPTVCTKFARVVRAG